jgi:small subunit ribosomal protein S3
MGHKVHPNGFRIGVIRDWQARWYADKHYAEFLREDMKLRKTIDSGYQEAAISAVEIERQANQVTMTIHTGRPGIVIGRGGQRVDEMRKHLEQIIGKKVQLNIVEIQQPELDAFLVAKNIAEQMVRRIAYRRAMKQAMLRTIQAGAKGMKVTCAGRLGGAEIARRLSMHEGQVPLHTLRADIDYGFTEAHTIMGRIGVKVWIYKGDVLPKSKEEEALEVAAIQAIATPPSAVTITAAEAAAPAPAPVVTPVETVVPAEPVAAEAPPETAPAAEKPAPKPRKRTTRKAAPKSESKAAEPTADAAGETKSSKESEKE